MMKTTFTPVNHLAGRIDKQRQSVERLPQSLLEHINELNRLTKDVKQCLTGCLPEEIMQTLQVGGFENQTLTLAATSQTAANHLIYQRSNLLHILTRDSLTFSELKHIKIILKTPALSSKLSLNHDKHMRVTAHSKHKQSVDAQGFSPKTKATITHTAMHVISDERLKAALLQLAEA